ncbi:sugar phosphate isomerase/epimerase family protein [Streptomyces sp. 8L]|uniref:sugar phosphate isomerase/epimerase family protein n=1 Tax=Streptomyces sp. 8L TaxID=2877242 RepID=UPI001CD552C3|nr:sugar phosphate isomerase/epimerase family protein [Streptomyces sp. 8L]MCA1220280.1 sugar phosphate isomerase/epimerase [Streptomyces sp. 8L]
MKLAFSTLGVPGMPIPEVAELAVSAGYQGVELRGHPEEPVHPGLGAAERASVVKEFARAGVEILTVAGYARAADVTVPDSAFRDEVDGLLRLARDLGASYVRVFPGGGDTGGQEADDTAARRLGAAAEAAADHGVRILLETHDSHRRGVDAERVVAAVGHPQVGVVWDLMHTWLGGEPPEVTRATLGPYLGYVQVKDIASAEDTTPLALGAGVLPLGECLGTLSDDTWVCWEYEKRWYEGAAALPPLLAPGRAHLEGLLGH